VKKIPINQFPIFHQYLFEFIKNNIDSSCSFDFVSQNINIIGYCQCGLKGCATIQLESKISFPHYPKTTTACNHTITQKLHLDDNFIIKEFEYIDKTSIDVPAFKNEVVAIFNQYQ
jgi:hypothetical protein